jgi:hypothetical protein
MRELLPKLVDREGELFLPHVAHKIDLRKLAFEGTPIAKPAAELAALTLTHVNVQSSKVSKATAKALWPKSKIES